MKFLIVGSVGPLNEFRIPELDSIAALYNFTITYPDDLDISVSTPSSPHFSPPELTACPVVQRPYLVVDLASEREARLIGDRAILVKHIWHYWADAATYDELHAIVKERKQLWVSRTSLRSTPPPSHRAPAATDHGRSHRRRRSSGTRPSAGSSS